MVLRHNHVLQQAFLKGGRGLRKIEKYLEEHLSKKITKPTPQLLTRPGLKGEKLLKRRMSVKGAIKKTRSITVEPDSLGMQGEETGGPRRQSTFEGNLAGTEIMVTPPEDEKAGKTSLAAPRSPSPEEVVQRWRQSPTPRHRLNSETHYADTEVEELLLMLKDTENLEEEGDILQYLMDSQGLQFQTGFDQEGKVVTVRELLKQLYEKACQQKLWGLVRHTAGMLGKRAEDLAKSVTDLVVRQKQVTIGMPPTSEQTITGALPDLELRQLIHQAYGDDQSSSMLTQELILYLAMFIRTEPQLFHEMLRLRVGLIIQVMAAELSRSLACSGEEASEHLLNLSPFEMKNLLHHILSGKEFALTSVGRGNYSIISCKSSRVSKKSQIGLALSGSGDSDTEERSEDRQGQWLRRRRLDGALNRVPRDFYPRVWAVLEKCQGLAIEGRLLPQNLTQEMTSGELKFALAVETALNSIPQPEYRQLMVEALMVLTLITEHNVVSTLGGIIPVDQLVHTANAIFLQDQVKVGGDATLCCGKKGEGGDGAGGLVCGGAAYICQHFYDSAPSGSYGTMTYVTRAVAKLINTLPGEHDLDCSIC